MPLPGLIPGVGGGSGGGSLSLSFVASNTSLASTVVIPASAQEGDLAVMFDAAGNSAPSAVTPSGWTNVANVGTGSLRVEAHYRVLAAGLAGTSVTGMNNDEEAKICMVFRPSRAIASVVASTWLTQAASDPAAQTVSASGVAVPLVVFGAVGGHAVASVSLSGSSPSLTEVAANGTAKVRAGYKIYNALPSDHIVDSPTTGTVALISGYLRVT